MIFLRHYFQSLLRVYYCGTKSRFMVGPVSCHLLCSSWPELATIRQSSGSYQSGVQRWFPPETSPGYNRSGICPAGCPALAAPSVSRPPSRSLSFHLIGALGLPTEARDKTWQQLLHVLYIIWCLQRCISHQWVTSWPVFCAILLVGKAFWKHFRQKNTSAPSKTATSTAHRQD